MKDGVLNITFPESVPETAPARITICWGGRLANDNDVCDTGCVGDECLIICIRRQTRSLSATSDERETWEHIFV